MGDRSKPVAAQAAEVDKPDELSVSFPATEAFTRIGRVAIAGVALRLGFDVTVVDRLRLAVDTAVTALSGPGRIDVSARWTSSLLEVGLSNSSASLERRGQLADQLASIMGGTAGSGDEAAHVPSVRIDQTSITLGIESA